MAQRQNRQRQLLYVSDSVDADYDLDTGSDLDRRSSRLLAEAAMEVEAVVDGLDETNERQPNSELQAFASTCSK